MKFCPECNTLLILNTTSKTLTLVCSACGYTEEEKNPIIYRQDFNSNSINESLIKNAKYNPTIEKSKKYCSTCKKDTLVSILREKDTLKQIIICTICDSYW